MGVLYGNIFNYLYKKGWDLYIKINKNKTDIKGSNIQHLKHNNKKAIKVLKRHRMHKMSSLKHSDKNQIIINTKVDVLVIWFNGIPTLDGYLMPHRV